MWGEIAATATAELASIKWGARAIKETSGFSTLHDRQDSAYMLDGQYVSHCPPELLKQSKLFFDWLNKKAIKKGQQWSDTVRESDGTVFSFDDEKHGYHYRASCGCSYGYVYMTSWADPIAKEV